ncbi:Nuclease-related domain-containing protein [Anoxynatronum buryatiense]|uniref:Nuclease-related domain-containing protein n=2 Tax=Anoxynatronum buryatiense TaxID=489973 RepID=A0AA45WW70_9CLOT|nr:Nuclease-related domain-containing protein [Anoxynatronum buryatiense]
MIFPLLYVIVSIYVFPRWFAMLVTYMLVLFVTYGIVFVKEFQAQKKEKPIKDRCKESKIEEIENTLCDQAVYRTPIALFNQDRLSLYETMFKLKEDPCNWYTNDEFCQKAIQLTNALDVAKKIEHEKCNLLGSHYSSMWHYRKNTEELFYAAPDSPIKRCQHMLKGHFGEVKAQKVLDNLAIEYMEGFNFHGKDSTESVEIDFLTIVKGTLYTIEVKDYSADEIAIESSGQLMKWINGRSEPLEIMNQVSRHGKFLRSIFGNQMQIISIIALSDKNTRVIDNFNSDTLKVVYVDALPFLIGAAQTEADLDLLSQLLKYKTKPKMFPFFDIDTMRSELHDQLLAERQELDRLLDPSYQKGQLLKLEHAMRKIAEIETGYDERYGNELFSPNERHEVVGRLMENFLTAYLNLLNELIENPYWAELYDECFEKIGISG